ncbi:MAG: hypothetical protein Q7T72_09420 [Bacteroidales bacterium]|nr:hypothetical protein [Bacteroidales bacterium]
MRTKVYLFPLILLLVPKVLLSQESENKESTTYKKNQIGIQFNPYINERLLSTGGLSMIEVVSSLRYGYRITKNVTTGMEFSCGFPININSGQNFRYFNYFGYKIGLYTRYSILSERRFQIFAEASPYFSHYWRELTSSSDQTPYSDNKFGYYVAPGVTLYSKSKIISFDLYYKFSDLTFTDGNNSVLSYKVNFNF